MSEIGMGLEYLLDKDEQTVISTIKAAVDGGVTYFDCHPGHDYDNRVNPDVYKLTLTYIASERRMKPVVSIHI